MLREGDPNDLDDLYREVILEHYRNPRNKGTVEKPDIRVEGINPFCGDETILAARLDDQDRIVEIAFNGQGCSISQASASMLTDILKGKTPTEAHQIMERFKALMHGQELTDEELDEMGDLEALQGVRKFPIRIRCVLLAWTTLEQGIKEYEAKSAGRS